MNDAKWYTNCNSWIRGYAIAKKSGESIANDFQHCRIFALAYEKGFKNVQRQVTRRKARDWQK